MDEFEKIRAFSEQMSQKTEEALKQENAESESQTVEENPDFLREWSHQDVVEQTPTKSYKKIFWSVFALATIVLICLIVVIFLLLHEPMDNQENVPTISPTPVPVKVKPENPGGMVIPDQDKVIYDRISHDPMPVKVEKLFPEEEPVLPPEEESVEPTIVVEEAEIPFVIEEMNEKLQEGQVDKNETLQSETVDVKTVVNSVPPATTSITPTSAPESEKPAPEIWHAQLFSSTDKVKVERIWKKILAKHKGLLSNMPMNIVKADIPGKGTFYRLQVGDFTTKDRAANLCTKLKKQKQDCVPAK